MKFAVTVAAFAGLILAGCSGELSNAESPSAQRLVYPLSAGEADAVLSQAMTATFPDSPISTVSLPGKGYTATIRFAIDSHQITAMALPARGIGPAGPVDGYEFQVKHAGTMPITAGNRSRELYRQINDRAAALRAPLPAAPGAR